ncbi:MAG: hypothetical protein A2284_11975 [Deltaproteobacteria bacterium RIFOXYA12_FULL_61_11]|nr:MAG: hypothetical protein A2284_11975 [Deltaproteobacteria bacterium RIFOXYA12_FULL_61_11]
MYIPRLRRDFELATIDENLHVLKSIRVTRYLEMSAEEYFVFTSIDGKADLEDIAVRFYERFKYIGHNEIVNLLIKLYEYKLLEEEPPNYIATRQVRGGLSRLGDQLVHHLDLTLVGKVLRYSPLRLLYVLPVFVVLLLASLATAVGFILFLDTRTYQLFSFQQGLAANITLDLGLFYGLLAWYCLGKLAALGAYDRQVNGFQVRLIGVIPWLSVDTSDILMTGLRGRLTTALSGSYLLLLTAMAGALHLLIGQYFPDYLPDFLRKELLFDLSYKVSILAYLLVFFKLSPFYPSDGLTAFTELFHFHTERAKILHYLKSMLVLRKSSGEKREDRESLRHELGLSLGATWSIAYFFGFLKIMSFLINSEAKLVFQRLIFADDLSTRVVSTIIMALIFLPPLFLLVYLFYAVEAWLLRMALRHKAWLLALLLQPALVSYVAPFPVAFPLYWTLSLVLLVAVFLAGRRIGYFPSLAERWSLLTVFLALSTIAILTLLGLNTMEVERQYLLGGFVWLCLLTCFLLVRTYRYRQGKLFESSFFQAIAALSLFPVFFVPDPWLLCLPVISLLLQLFALRDLFATLAELPAPKLSVSAQDNGEVLWLALLAELGRTIIGRWDDRLASGVDAFKFLEGHLGLHLARYLALRAGHGLPLYQAFTLQQDVIEPSRLPLTLCTHRNLQSLENLIKRIPLFARAEGEELTILLKHLKSMEWARGQYILREGESGDQFFAIQEGVVDIYKKDRYGYDTKIGTLFEGDCFGEIALLEHTTRQATVIAQIPTTLLYLDRGPFNYLIEQYPGMRTKLLSTLHRANLLRSVSIFHSLTSTQIFSLASKAEERNSVEGDVVIREGEEGREFFVITRGKFEVTRGGQVLTMLGERNFFGEIALLKEVSRTATVSAKAEGELLVIQKAEFLQAMSSNTTLSAKLREITSDRQGGNGHA